MTTLPYTVIKSESQYQQYANRLQALSLVAPDGAADTDEMELLALLLANWDDVHHPVPTQEPIPLLKNFMADHGLKASTLGAVLGISKSLMSDILNLRRGLSKEVIRKLAVHFSVSQEAFNRPYALKVGMNSHLRDAKVMNTRKELAA